MYIIFELNGKQYDGYLGEEISVDLLSNSGKQVKLDKILLFKHTDKEIYVGMPYLAGAAVTAAYRGEVKDRKIVVFQYRKRKTMRKKTGHRTRYSRLFLESIKYDGKEYKPEPPKKVEKKPVKKSEKKAEPQTTATKKSVKKPSGKAVKEKKSGKKPAKKS